MNHAVGTPHICDTPRRSEQEQRDFHADIMSRALAADALGRSGEAWLTLAGARIRLVFASENLRRDLLPAVAHLQTAAGPGGDAAIADAVIYVWDSETTGIAMAPAPCRPDCFTERGDIWGFDSAQYRTSFYWGDCSVSTMDMATGIGAFWVRAAEDLAYWTRAAPLRTHFHWLMLQRGGHLLHAAVVGTGDGGVLICGKGGVGKSTTALACLAGGLKYVADDYVVVRCDPEPAAFRLYGTAKLEPADLARFPALRGLLTGGAVPEGEKAVLNLSRSDEYRIEPVLTLAAALTPRFAPAAETEFRPVAPGVLVQAGAFTTMAQLPHAGRASYEFIERLMNRLPCYEILLGRDIDGIPAALAGFLARPLSAAGRATADATTRRPFISVVIPVYNGAHFLRDAIGSILAQDYTPLEIIVVDDGSTDDLAGAVRELDVDLRLLRQQNLGPAAARNLGIRNCAGEYFAFLDIDDLWPPDMLASLGGRLTEQPELDIVQGYGQLMRSSGEDGAQEFIGSARESFPYYISAALYRRRAFEQIGLFDAELRLSEDTDWFLRAREAGLVTERMEQVTLRIRRHDGNMTRNRNLRDLGALRLFKKALDRRRAQDADR